MKDLIDQGADVLGSTQDSRGVVLLQTGDAVSPEVIGDRAELWQQTGFCSRPAKAIPGKSACQAIALKGGANDQVIATRDARCTLPAGLGEGETCLYAGGPNNAGTAQIRLSDDGSTATITLKLRQGNVGGGAERKITIASSGAITIDAGGSSRITITESGGIELGLAAPSAVALEPALTAWITQLLVSLASGANSGGPVVFSVPLPSAPSIAATKVKAL